ncbi:hypothetical protein [Sphingomonas sp. MMS24-J13]|uniref:hypothetical protein n=1 Tax=Sphingomonas sp. MMS24-J13 TaxID=3238686 RepID=UPI00384F2E98
MTREIRIGVGALAFVGVVVMMLPPTTPLAPAGTPTRPRAAAAAIAQDPSASGIAEPAYYTPPLPAMPASNPTPVSQDSAMPTRYADAAPVQPRWRDPAPADADDQGQAGSDDAFATGYRWAEQNGIEDRRDCRRWRGSPAESGCRAFLRDSDVGDDHSEDEYVADMPQ